MTRFARIGALVCASTMSVGVLGGCKTTIVQSATSTIPADVTTTTQALPADTPTQLNEIIRLTASLGDLVADGGSGPVLNRINALWAVAAKTVGPTDAGLRQQIDVQIAIIQTGVKYKRAADEDKAATNLQAIVTVYLQRHPRG